MIPLIIGVVLMYAFFNAPSEQVPGSKNFHMSDGASAAMYKHMKDQGMSDENLKRFVIMEDHLLELEKVSVCTGIPRIGEATSMSQQIKDHIRGLRLFVSHLSPQTGCRPQSAHKQIRVMLISPIQQCPMFFTRHGIDIIKYVHDEIVIIIGVFIMYFLFDSKIIRNHVDDGI
jgi:hypothetical protein